jgi:hypothetical protein
MLGMEILLALGIGIGLSCVAGVRAFVPLALVAFFVQLGLFAPPAPYDAGWSWAVVGMLAGLAILEIVLDKIPALDPAFGYVMVPVRMASGAVLFAAALGMTLDAGSAPWLAAGAAIAGVVAVLEVVLRPPKRVTAAGVSAASLSFFEDAVALVGGALGFFVPFVPLLLVAFLLFFFYRVRKRRGRKFGGLRILGD